MIGLMKEKQPLFASIRDALRGARHAISERNIKIQVGIGGAVLAAGIIVGLTPPEWALVLLACGTVLGAEMFNTALEQMLDILVSERHPAVGKIKDISAGAVLVACGFAAAAGLLIFSRVLL